MVTLLVYKNMMNQNWSMSDERAFMENLLNQRFNFFVVFYSAIMASYLAISDLFQRFFVLLIGLTILILMYLTIIRAQNKLDQILEKLHGDKNHPAAIINNAVGPNGSKRKIIGLIIPLFCVISLLVLFLVQIFTMWNLSLFRNGVSNNLGMTFTIISWVVALVTTIVGKKITGKWTTVVNLLLIGFSIGILLAYIF